MRNVHCQELNQQHSVADLISLNKNTSHHLSRVLRCKVDEALILFNGKDTVAKCKINQISKQAVCVEITELLPALEKPTLNIHLGIAVSKGKRMDTIMQKCTELGVTSITPLTTEYLAFKFDTQLQAKKHEHWQSVIENSCEQSENFLLPTLHETVELAQWHQNFDSNALKLCLHPDNGQSLRDLANEHKQVNDLVLLIGPEGGLGENDLAFAQSNNFKNMTLGPRILRTETAPTAMLAIAQHLWGDFS